MLMYIDPSFKSTGVFTVDPSQKRGSFYTVTTVGTKMSLEKYWLASDDIVFKFAHLILNQNAYKITDIYLESPFIRGFSSESMHMLQVLFFKKFQEWAEHLKTFPRKIHSITAAYIKGAVTREFKRRGLTESKKKISDRNTLITIVLTELESQGWIFYNKELILENMHLDDCATAFFLWYLSQPDKDNKEFPSINLFANEPLILEKVESWK